MIRLKLKVYVMMQDKVPEKCKSKFSYVLFLGVMKCICVYVHESDSKKEMVQKAMYYASTKNWFGCQPTLKQIKQANHYKGDL